MNASVLSRLALALLVAMGFVVPTAAVRRADVVQGVARPARLEVEARELAAPQFVSTPVVKAVGLQSRTSVAERLFLRHRALVL